MSLAFSVGSAIYDSPPNFSESIRTMFTAMSLQIHHPHIKEYIIVDNAPHPDNPLRHMPSKTDGFVRYVEMPEPQGTSAPRNRVFAEAKHDYVACIDAHVLLYPGFFSSLEEFYQEHGADCPDLIHGPMMTEKRSHVMGTHMNDQWRAQMWGTWAWGWEKDGKRFSVMTEDDQLVIYMNLPDDCQHEQRPLSTYEIAQRGLPQPLGWSGHEKVLYAAGCTNPTEPFPIPSHGMGFFACRKDSWLPFHPLCKGFGGEEMTTGYRFRKAGRLVWCVPGAKWWHHFDRPGGQVPYLIARWDRIRNYCLEFNRLGLNPQKIRNHFDHTLCSEGEWQQALAGLDWPTPIDGVTEDYYPDRQAAHKAQLAGGHVHESRTKLLSAK